MKKPLIRGRKLHAPLHIQQGFEEGPNIKQAGAPPGVQQDHVLALLQARRARHEPRALPLGMHLSIV